MKSLVSIIIPVHNRAQLIGETLDSIILQTYRNWECIVIDDGSTDYTEELLEFYCEKDSRISFYHRPCNRLSGGNAARNYGLEKSSGEYILWFDSDDIMKPSLLERSLSGFREDISVLIFSCIWISDDKQKIKTIELDENCNLFADYALWKLKIVTGCVIFKKTFLLEKQLFLEFLIRGQEAEFFSRLFFDLEKKDYHILNEPLFYYRQHAKSKTFYDKIYDPAFKFSIIFTATENFERAIILRDKELVQKFYNKLINLFFICLENKDRKNAKIILRNLLFHLKYLNNMVWVKLFVFGNLFIKANRGSYRIEQIFKREVIIHNLT